jgi:hypothetical protein
MVSYVEAIISIPTTSLHHLASPPWASWFYAIIVACKLVFLEDNERDAQTDIDSTDCEVITYMTDEGFDRHAPHKSIPLPTEPVTTTSWDAISVAKTANLQNLFDRFIKKMQFTAPADAAAMDSENFDPLFCMTCLQLSLSHGFSKRMKEHLFKTNTTNNKVIPNTPLPYATRQPGVQATQTPQYTQLEQAAQTSAPPFDQPLVNTFNFNVLNFDSIQFPDSEESQQPAYDDWLWDTIMNDFSMPPL